MKSLRQIRREHEHDRALSVQERDEQFKKLSPAQRKEHFLWEVDQAVMRVTGGLMLTSREDPSALDVCDAAGLLLSRVFDIYTAHFDPDDQGALPVFLEQLSTAIRKDGSHSGGTVMRVFNRVFPNGDAPNREEPTQGSSDKQRRARLQRKRRSDARRHLSRH